MRKLILLCTSLCAMVLLISASPVRAQNVLWVSTSGSDANVCSQTSPCATFQGAINKGSVAQINCLSSGNYGAFTVTASITIDCGTGQHRQRGPSVGTAITLNTSLRGHHRSSPSQPEWFPRHGIGINAINFPAAR